MGGGSIEHLVATLRLVAGGRRLLDPQEYFCPAVGEEFSDVVHEPVRSGASGKPLGLPAAPLLPRVEANSYNSLGRGLQLLSKCTQSSRTFRAPFRRNFDLPSLTRMTAARWP